VKLPKSILIGPYPIAVRGVVDMSEDMECIGDYNSHYQRIRLDTGLKGIRMAETLLHEILHGIYYAYGLVDSDEEEKIVSLMSTGLFKVLMDNPELLQLINETINDNT